MTDLISFQSHTLSHPNLTKLDDNSLEQELSESKKIIEKITNNKVIAFAYPLGHYNDKVINSVQKYYKYAVLNSGGIYTTNGNDYTIKRIYVSRDLNLASFKKKITPTSK